jgi:hypothetical protein
MNGGWKLSHLRNQDERRPDRSSIDLLDGVRMTPDMREIAIVQMRRSEALVDLAVCVAAGIRPKLHRLSHGTRHRASVLKRTFATPLGASGKQKRVDSRRTT